MARFRGNGLTFILKIFLIVERKSLILLNCIIENDTTIHLQIFFRDVSYGIVSI